MRIIESPAVPFTGTTTTASRARRRRARAGRLAGTLFVVPALAIVAFFVVYPLLRMVYLSLTDYNGLTDPVWAGLANYQYLLQWPDFERIVLNTFLLLLGIPLWVAGPFVVAVILYGSSVLLECTLDGADRDDRGRRAGRGRVASHRLAHPSARADAGRPLLEHLPCTLDSDGILFLDLHIDAGRSRGRLDDDRLRGVPEGACQW
jgi:hypothetical protein